MAGPDCKVIPAGIKGKVVGETKTVLGFAYVPFRIAGDNGTWWVEKSVLEPVPTKFLDPHARRPGEVRIGPEGQCLA
jgi:hypothetical protein